MLASAKSERGRVHAVPRGISENGLILRSLGVLWIGFCVFAACPIAQAEPPVLSIEAAPSLFLANQEHDVALQRAGSALQSSDAFAIDSKAIEIARTAAARSGKAWLLLDHLRVEGNRLHHWFTEERNAVESTLLMSAVCRERQLAAAAVLRLHHAIAATMASLELIGRTKGYLQQQERAQLQLIDQGIPIADPMLLDRARMQTEDESLVALSRLQQLRIELSRWVGSDIACGYTAAYDPVLHPSDSDVCEYVHQAMRCRCELRVLRMLKDDLDARDLEDWDRVATSLVGVPAVASAAPRASMWTFLTHVANADAVSDRARWIHNFHQERAQHVTIEVETAYEKKRSSALRWVLSEQMIAAWDQRVEQLERMNELKGNFPQQVQANLDRFRAQGEVIERWYEWHEANIELGLATGTDW